MKRSTKGVWLLASPFVLLVAVLILYAVVNAVFSGVVDSSVVGVTDSANVVGEGNLKVVIGRVINVALGGLGVLAIGLFFIGWPVGIYLIVSKGKDGRAAHEELPGKK